MTLSATNFPELGVVYKRVHDGPKYFIPVTVIHRLAKKQLDTTLASVQQSKYIKDEVKFESKGESNGCSKLGNSGGFLSAS